MRSRVVAGFLHNGIITHRGRGYEMKRKIGTQPHVLEETAGKKAYCQCGLSANLPYCDGAHKQCDEEIGPIVCQVEADGKKAVCMCYRTGNAPWCDGSHKNP